MPGTGHTNQSSSPLLYRLFFVAFLSLAGYAVPAAAVTVDGLYTAEVPVAGSSPAQLQAGYAEGLRQVLLRVSGSSEVLEQEGIADLLGNAESLLQSYQFLRGNGSGMGNHLRMTFGAVGVNQALSSINAPVWGANRPLTLAWIAVQDGSGRHLISREDEQADERTRRWQRAFLAAAAERGLPLTAPPADLAEDRELLSEVWGQFMDSVKTQSESLGYDLLAAVRISFERNAWRASWVMEGRSMEERGQGLTASSPEQMAQQIVGTWADMLAARYAVAAGDAGASPRVDIVLDDLDSLEDYAAAKQALAGMTPVLSVGPVRVRADQSTLRVSFSGELSQLEEYVALDARFVPVAVGPVEAAGLPVVRRPEVANDQPAMAGDVSTAPDSTEPAQPAAATGDNATAGMFSYQPLTLSPEESEQAFEALYPILHYRWQGNPVSAGSGQE